MSNNEPKAIKEWKKSFFFGIVRIDYYVEDRRPDLTELECIHIGKYKHFLTMWIGWKRLNWTFRTSHRYEDLPFGGKV